jgi:hypothetical protein
MSFKCPNCETEIYSRAHKTCHTCGSELPRELLLPGAQLRILEENAKRTLKAERDADRNVNPTPVDFRYAAI